MKDKPVKGTHKKTIHDGSKSYSIVIDNPEYGKGKHFKPPKNKSRAVMNWILYNVGHLK